MRNTPQARPGHKFIPFSFAFSVANAISGPAVAKELALSAGRHGTAANLVLGGFPADVILSEGATVTDFTITADNSNLNCDFLTNFLESRRVLVTDMELTSDQSSQFSKAITVAPSTPGNVEKKRTILIKQYKTVNQNSSTEVKMNLADKNEHFWLGPDHVVTVKVVATSTLDVILEGFMEIPIN